MPCMYKALGSFLSTNRVSMEHMTVNLQLMRWRQEDQDFVIILGYDRGFKASMGYMSACLKTKTNMLRPDSSTSQIMATVHCHLPRPEQPLGWTPRPVPKSEGISLLLRPLRGYHDTQTGNQTPSLSHCHLSTLAPLRLTPCSLCSGHPGISPYLCPYLRSLPLLLLLPRTLSIYTTSPHLPVCTQMTPEVTT